LNYIIDTYAWIEYFSGSVVGKKAKPMIERGENCTPTVVLAELKRKFLDEGRNDFAQVLDFIHVHSNVLPLDEAIAINAGEIRATLKVKGMGLVDCILLALSRIYSLKVLTGDLHFQKLPEAEFLTGAS